MASIFEVDENGQITYEQSGTTDGSASVEEVLTDETAADPEVSEAEILESEVLESGNNVTENADSGDILSDSLQSEEVPSETQEVMVFNTVDGSVPVALSDEVTTALLDATTPAGGSLGASTLDYFDRIIGSLPTDAVYVAYRTNSDNSYDGVLYYGDDYDYSDNVITFGENARQIHVERVSSNYSTVTEYTEYSAEDTTVALSKSGDVVYYSNCEVGYPVLGGYIQPTGFYPLLVAGLMSAMAVVVLQKLLLKR